MNGFGLEKYGRGSKKGFILRQYLLINDRI